MEFAKSGNGMRNSNSPLACEHGIGAQRAKLRHRFECASDGGQVVDKKWAPIDSLPTQSKKSVMSLTMEGSMGGKWRKSVCAIFAIAVTTLGVNTAAAGSLSGSDTWSGDYGLFLLPKGTIAALDYLGFSDNDKFVDTNGNKVGGHARIWSNIARIAYITEFGGTKVAFEAALPYATLNGVDIAGVPQTTHGGFFSPVLFQDVGLIVSPQRILALTSYEFLPIGDYDNTSTINVATPQQFVWVGQVGYSEGLKKFGLDNFWFDLDANVSIHGNGKNPFSESPIPGVPLPGVAAYSTATQKPSYNLKGFIRYTAAFGSVAVGLEKSWGGLLTYTGGTASIAGLGTSALPDQDISKDDYLRGHLQVSLNLAPDAQVALDLHHDFERVGGFQENFGAEVRFLKLFFPSAPGHK